MIMATIAKGSTKSFYFPAETGERINGIAILATEPKFCRTPAGSTKTSHLNSTRFCAEFPRRLAKMFVAVSIHSKG